MKKELILIFTVFILLASNVSAINLLDDFNKFFEENGFLTGNAISPVKTSSSQVSSSILDSFIGRFTKPKTCAVKVTCQGNSVISISKDCTKKITKCGTGKCKNGVCSSEKICTPQMICNQEGNTIFQGSNCGLCEDSVKNCNGNGCNNGICNNPSSNPPTPTTGNNGGSTTPPVVSSCDGTWRCSENGKDIIYSNDATGVCIDHIVTTCANGCNENTDCNPSPGSSPCKKGYICKDANTFVDQYSDCSLVDMEPHMDLSLCKKNGCWQFDYGAGCGCDKDFSCQNDNGNFAVIQRNNDCTQIVTPCSNLGCSTSLDSTGTNRAQCVTETQCAAGWSCNGNNRIYTNGDCSTQNYEYCNNGCSNGKCNPTCEPGIICTNNGKSIAYQNSDCTLCGTSLCSFGCENAACKKNPPETPPCQTTADYKCKNQNTAGYQNADCTWRESQSCQYGCNSVTKRCNPRTSTTLPGNIAGQGPKVTTKK